MKKIKKLFKLLFSGWADTVRYCIESGALDFSGQGRDAWGPFSDLKNGGIEK